SLHQLRMLEQEFDDGVARRVFVGVQPELGEALVLAHELGGLIGDGVEDALEVGSAQRVLQVLDDVELDAAVVEDLHDAGCLASAGVVVHEKFRHKSERKRAGYPGEQRATGEAGRGYPRVTLGRQRMRASEGDMADHRDTFLGRDDVNDVEAILADDAIDFGEFSHSQRVGGDAIFTWDYDRSRPALAKLYEKAKVRQWNAVDLPWDTDVDVEAVAMEMAGAVDHLRVRLTEIEGSPMKAWTQKEWTQFAIEAFNFRMSQFLHGEQGALICTAKIVETVPWIDAKYYAATQVVDEARHVEVFSRYLDTKLDGHYTVNPALQLLIDDVIADSRWDMTYMGMQIMIEGLALAAFGFMHMVTEEPLLKQLLRYVLADEARHVAFGVISLQEYYQQLSAAEILERQEFAFEAAIRMRDPIIMHAVWE